MAGFAATTRDETMTTIQARPAAHVTATARVGSTTGGGALAAPTPRASDPPSERARASDASRGERLLRVGSRGRDVAELKASLRRQRYAVDRGSTFTEQTRHAVMAFQKVNGLDRDGVVGPQTHRALRNPRRPQIGTGPSNRVVVDLSEQVLYMVRDGRLSKVVNASTGNPNHPDGRGEATPRGTFRVFRHVHGPDRGPLGTLYDPSYFHRGIAVHGAPHVPAYRDSHGCVRIPMHLSRQIQSQMPDGTTVKVRA